MADEQYRWLNRETAERLLNGESPEAAGPAGRDQAERLARALGALSAPPSSAGGELPGEAAALAAFREAREERTDRAGEAVPAVPVEGRSGSGTAQGADVGLVRIGVPPADRSGAGRTPRRARLMRFGLAAALAAGMVGGAAVLAGTGVLPAPSGVSGPPATATATGSPERPLPPPPSKKGAPGGATPEGEQDRQSGDADGDPGRQHGPGTGADEDGGPAETGVNTDGLAADDGRGKRIASACRALRDGRGLPENRRRLLEDAAGGPGKVGPYCENVLARHGTGAGTGEGSAPDSGHGSGSTAKRDGGHGRSDNGNEGDGGRGNGNGNAGNGRGNGNGNGKEGDGGRGNGRQGNGKGGGGNGGKHGRGADGRG
ncbi:hypothetical protein [Streptomyces sp. MAR25Y5]|uniref:hypothetical protein n=1 Tax=Streptomyces sp. MAR25Y5 TaxID=2962028 RepID=UPI0020B6D714|nr:hypothetical protein [Streptomyces sp. MAR25Y5]MCP3766622.1 hypothetical protein [Streptomyces sp. MAR25Y5]